MKKAASKCINHVQEKTASNTGESRKKLNKPLKMGASPTLTAIPIYISSKNTNEGEKDMRIKVVVKGQEVIMSRKEFLKKYQKNNNHYQNKIQRTGTRKCL